MPGKAPVHPTGRVKKYIAAGISLLFLLLLLVVPAPALSGARRGLSLCGETVIPSLFPFLVLSSFIIGSGLADAGGRFFEPVLRRVFRMPGSAGTAIILGAIGGYPVGASAVSQLCKNGSLSKRQGERLLCFAINSSPAFIIGAVGTGFLGSTQAGMLLYAAHLATSLSIGLLLRGHPKKTSVPLPAVPVRAGKKNSVGFSGAFVAAVTGSARSIITISAFVVLFSSVNALMDYTGATNALAQTLSSFLPAPGGDDCFYSRALAGVLEVTNGCAAAAGSCGMPAVLLSAAMLGFSGLSVQFQVISMIRESGLSARLFILTRFLHLALSVLFSFVLFSLFPQALPVSRSASVFAWIQSSLTVSFHNVPAVCAMLFICIILLLSLAQV